MKKIISILSLIVLLMNPLVSVKAQNGPNYNQIHETLLYTLTPYINQAVVNYYGYMKQYDLYDAKVLSINREPQGLFVRVQITTFEHAHNYPYGIETITFLINPSKVEIREFEHIGDHHEKQIKQFYDETLLDIKQSFNLDLSSYKEYSSDQIFYLSSKQEEFKSLKNIVLDIMLNILNPEIKPQYKNIISPVTYLKDHDGFILFKRKDGTNVLYKIYKENNTWIVEEQQNKKGKQMKNELIWYM